PRSRTCAAACRICRRSGGSSAIARRSRSIACSRRRSAITASARGSPVRSRSRPRSISGMALHTVRTLAALPPAALLSWLLPPLGGRIAWWVGWLDQPAARKLHTTATAMLGGAVVFVAAIATWLLLLGVVPHSTSRWEAWYLLAGAAVILGVGLWDDRM